MITDRNSGKETGPNIEPVTQLTKTAPSLNPTTGKVPNNAPNPGNAEVPDSAREADGAPDMTAVREPHFPIKLQESSQIIDQLREPISVRPRCYLSYIFMCVS